MHRLIYNALYTYFDTKYIATSYSCRKGYGTHKAYRKFRKYVNKVSKNYTKACYVLTFDIQKCFENIDRGLLKKIIGKHIVDTKVFNLVSSIVDSFHKGLPLGNVTSQMCINIYLHECDWYSKQEIKNTYYIRYADDLTFLSCSKEDLEIIYIKVSDFLYTYLHLVAHKKQIRSIYAGVDILGVVFFGKYERLRRSTERRRKVIL